MFVFSNFNNKYEPLKPEMITHTKVVMKAELIENTPKTRKIPLHDTDTKSNEENETFF